MQSAIRSQSLAWGRVDARNLCLLLIGFAVVLFLIPPMRAYPMSDDWAYAQSVERMLDLTYRPHDWTQPTALGHVVWGTLFTFLFGFNFTALTAATLFVSALCLPVFYTLLRHLRVAPTAALLGTALLGLNPLYIYLSYTFMTDITFMLYVLGACLCFVRWAQGSGDRWLLLGGVVVGLAYLTRQHGIVLLPAMLFFLWWSRRLTWRSAMSLCAVPLAMIATYMVWERMQLTPLVAELAGSTVQQILANPPAFALVLLQKAVLVLAIPGLCLLPLLPYFKPRKPLLALPVLLLFILLQVRSLSVYGTVFPAIGSLVDHGGLVMYDYDKAPIWSEAVWMLVALAGASVISLYIVSVADELWTRLRARRQAKEVALAPGEVASRRHADPSIIVYTSGALLAMVTFFSPFLFDRYILPLLPMMMLFPLKRMSAASETRNAKREMWRSAVLLVPMALFSLLAMRDYRAHSEARWSLAGRLMAQGAAYEQVSAGYEWLSWYLFDTGAERVRAGGDDELVAVGQPYQAVLDPVYLVGEWSQQGYREIASVEYQCWLCGGATRRVLAQERLDR